jgi:hypothetical protein
MSSDRIQCPVCDDSGLFRFLRTMGEAKRMPWTLACRCGHGDRYAEFMARVTEESFRMAAGLSKAAA